MARKLKITVTTASNLVVVQDYDNATNLIHQMLNCGTGEFTMEQSGNVDLTNAAAMVTFVHRDGARFGAALIGDIESVTINGVAATITNLSLVRDAVAPYFFNSGSGYRFYKEITVTSAMLLNDLALVSDLGGIEVLPYATGSQYDYKIIHELHFNSIAYTRASQPGFYSQTAGSSSPVLLTSLPTTALNFAGNRALPPILPQMSPTNLMPIHGVGDRIIYKLANNLNQTDGNGFVKLKVWWTPIIFG